MTLAEFLAARLDEEKAAARAASPGPWHLNAEHDEVLAVDDVPVTDAFALSGPQLRATAAHIARHDPARVLREAASLRKILARHAPHQTAAGGLACDWCSEDTDDRPQLAKVSWPCGDVRDIAAIWSDHPDYDPSWERE